MIQGDNGDGSRDHCGRAVDEAIRLHPPLEAFLGQAKDEATSLNEGYQRLAGILGNLETEK